MWGIHFFRLEIDGTIPLTKLCKCHHLKLLFFSRSKSENSAGSFKKQLNSITILEKTAKCKKKQQVCRNFF